MSKKRMIDTSFWSDPWVVDRLSIVERHLFIYLFTNEHTTIAGIYEMSLRTMSNETGFERDELVRMLERLKPKVYYVDGWVVLKNGIKNQNYHSPKIRTAIEMVLARCPQDLIEHVEWPDDYGQKPEASSQLKLTLDDLEDMSGDKQRSRGKSIQNRVKTDNMPVPKLTTSQSVKYGMYTVSHLNTNTNTNTVVMREPVEKSVDNSQTAGTTGLKLGKGYAEVTLLYEDLNDLVNDKFREWYCSAFYKIGRQRIVILASQAKADTNGNAGKLFSHLISKELERIKS